MTEIKPVKDIPYVVFEGIQTRNELTLKRLTTALIVSIVLIFACNMAWLYAWTQYDYSSSETVTVDGNSGTANYIGGDEDITNGENYSN